MGKLTQRLRSWLFTAIRDGGEANDTPVIGPLNSYVTWMRICLYALFFFSASSIAGVGAAAVLLYGLTLYHLWKEPPHRTLPWWLLIGLLAFPATAFVSALLNPSPFMNVVQLRREYSIFLPLILLPVLARISLRRLLLVLMFPVCVMASYSVIQYYWGVDWIPPFNPLRAHESASGTVYYAKGSFSHHLTFSGYMLLVLLLFAGLFWRGEGRDRIIWGFAALMAGAGVIVSLGRSGWVGMAIGLLLLVLGFPRRLALPLTAAVLLVGLSVSAVATGWLQGLKPWLPEWGIVNRLISTSLTHDRERLYLWESALLGIQDRPWFGVGYGNDKRYMRKYRAQVTEKRHYQFTVRPSTHSHNVYLQVAFELGIVGLAWYLAFWGVILVWSVRWARRARDLLPFETALLTGISVALVGSMVAGFFENNFFDAEVRTMILTLMGLSLYVGLSVRRQLREPPQ